MLNPLIKKKYPFVDFIRFFSLAGIVFAHTDIYPDNWNFFTHFHQFKYIVSYIALKQIFKFSNICFFMISGYLIADSLKIISPIELFKRRINSILTPFLISFSIFIALLFIKGDFKNALGHYDINSLKDIVYFMFYSPFWFIPSYFFMIFIILLCYQYVNEIAFSLIVLSITAYYTFSLSFQFKNHTTEIPAFISYIWLGIIVNKYNLINKIKKTSLPFLLSFIVITFSLACYQTYILYIHNNPYYFNNLRFFNQTYSVLIFCLLAKICPEKPDFWKLKPEQETYGVYLYHFFVVIFILKPIIEFIGLKNWFPKSNMFLVLGIFIIEFLFCYVIGTLFIKLVRFLKIPIL